jgi:hypothetical protein
MAKPTQADAEAAVRVLIEWAGDDPSREGLIDTPGRDGTRRTLGRSDERNLPHRVGCRLDGGETFSTPEGRSVQEHAVRHVRELGNDHAGGDFWCGEPFVDYWGRPQRSASLQSLKKRGLAKSTDGKWTLRKVRSRRARS